MADETTQSGGESSGRPTFTIHTQYIKDMSVENPNAPRIFMDMKEAPEVSINLDVAVQQLQGDTYEVSLESEVTATADERTAFVIELNYGGVVTLEGVENQQQREGLLLIEVPQFLFPFARAVISAATRDAGFPPLLVSPIDFVRLYQERRAKAEAAQQGEGSEASA
jgi:preprotein translocase subunit SecB